VILQGAMNGARTKADRPTVPHTLDEIAADAAAAIAAGANEFHAHVYAGPDRESLAPDAVAAWVSAIRAVAPGAFVGISTGDWIEGDDERRLDYIKNWMVLPDHTSVNLEETGAIEVIRALHARGVGVEAGLSTVADAERFRDSGIAPLVLRILVEPYIQDVDEALRETDGMLAVLDTLDSPKPILFHGLDATAWPFLERAIERGYSMRIGLEDTNVLPNGEPALGNADILAAAAQLISRSRSR
jgi:uncharacterized protein (DUF849 family)